MTVACITKLVMVTKCRFRGKKSRTLNPPSLNPDFVTRGDDLEKMEKAKTESQVSRWWCRWLSWGRWEVSVEGRNPGSLAPKAAPLVTIQSESLTLNTQ